MTRERTSNDHKAGCRAPRRLLPASVVLVLVTGCSGNADVAEIEAAEVTVDNPKAVWQFLLSDPAGPPD